MRENYWKYLKKNIWWILLLVVAKVANGGDFDLVSTLLMGAFGIFVVSGIQWTLWSKDYRNKKDIKELIDKLFDNNLIKVTDTEDLSNKVHKIMIDVNNRDEMAGVVYKHKNEKNVYIVLCAINEIVS